MAVSLGFDPRYAGSNPAPSTKIKKGKKMDYAYGKCFVCAKKIEPTATEIFRFRKRFEYCWECVGKKMIDLGSSLFLIKKQQDRKED